MSVDVKAIKVGDEVALRAKVTEVDMSDANFPLRVTSGWVRCDDIVSHTPAPREFKPGDRVFISYDSRLRGKVIGIDEQAAWVKTDRASDQRFTVPISDLRHEMKTPDWGKP